MKIIVNNNKCRLVGDIKTVMKLRKHAYFSFRAKGAFYSPAFRSGRWDGMIRFISETGLFDTGKLPQVVKVLTEELNTKVKLIDEREDSLTPKIKKKLGEKTLREDQVKVIDEIINYKIGPLEFPRGIVFAATNFGKTITSAGIHKAYRSKTLFLLNSKDLFMDAMREMPKLLPGQVGLLASGYPEEWNDFMIVMVQTAKSRLSSIKQKLASYPVVLVDEGDLAVSSTYKAVLECTYNSFVRIALTGSAMVDKREKQKNEKLRAAFGEIISETRNRELIDKGISSEVLCEVHSGNTEVFGEDFITEYKEGIICSKERNRKVIKVAIQDVKNNDLPILIITKNHLHVKKLFKRVEKNANLVGGTLFGLKIDWVHHEREGRQQIVRKFEEGKIDILVGSYILKRGKNFPLMRSVIHAGAGDSMRGILQLIGRATRKHDSKKHTKFHDFYDEGNYLRRHSKHRISTLKNEKFPIKLLYK